MTQKQLTDEELSKVAAGTNTLNGHTVGDSHIYDYPGGGAHLKLTITGIDESRLDPFCLKLEYMRANYQIYLTEENNWMTLSDLNHFWS